VTIPLELLENRPSLAPMEKLVALYGHDGNLRTVGDLIIPGPYYSLLDNVRRYCSVKGLSTVLIAVSLKQHRV